MVQCTSPMPTLAEPSHASQTIKVLTTDPQALNYILNSYKFEKPEHARLFLGDILGKGRPKLDSA